MLTEPLIEQLTALRLHGMAASLEQQIASPDITRQPFESRLGLMIQQERLERGNARLAQRLRWAKLPRSGVHRRPRYAYRSRHRSRTARAAHRPRLGPRAPQRPHHRTHRRR